MAWCKLQSGNSCDGFGPELRHQLTELQLQRKTSCVSSRMGSSAGREASQFMRETWQKEGCPWSHQPQDWWFEEVLYGFHLRKNKNKLSTMICFQFNVLHEFFKLFFLDLFWKFLELRTLTEWLDSTEDKWFESNLEAIHILQYGVS
jgi:hypothetical protein